jgi:hypothetical protein
MNNQIKGFQRDEIPLAVGLGEAAPHLQSLVHHAHALAAADA